MVTLTLNPVLFRDGFGIVHLCSRRRDTKASCEVFDSCETDIILTRGWEVSIKNFFKSKNGLAHRSMHKTLQRGVSAGLNPPFELETYTYRLILPDAGIYALNERLREA